jgi:predicted outer membrane repeat protein
MNRCFHIVVIPLEDRSLDAASAPVYFARTVDGRFVQRGPDERTAMASVRPMRVRAPREPPDRSDVRFAGRTSFLMLGFGDAAMSKMRIGQFLLLGACAAFGARSEAFIVYKVGGDECPYHDIQSALDDAAANPGRDYVWIANTGTYSGQHVVVTNDSVILEGGFSDCFQDVPDTTPAVLRGTDGHSVLEIEGASEVALINLVLTGATMDESHRGGGIYFGGQGTLELANTTVSFNTAGYGAGIDLNGGTGPAKLVLHNDSLILSNTALASGGGVRVEGNARLFVLEPSTLIAFNHADAGYGGGVEVIGPAQADIGSGGYGGIPVISGNTAAYGGGMDAFSVDDGQDTMIRLFSTDPANAVSISSNTASNTGGAIYLKSLNDIFGAFAITRLCASDFRMHDNIAAEGTAIYSDTASIEVASTGAYIALNLTDNSIPECNAPEPPSDLGATHCGDGVPCNRIDGNTALDGDGNPTDGSAVLLQSAGLLIADRVALTDNTGGHALRAISDDIFTQVRLSDCLVANNVLSDSAIAATDGDQGEILIDGCTIARNTLGASSASITIPVPDFYLLNTIIDEVGHLSLDPTTPNAAYVLSNETTSLPVTVTIVEGSPEYVDADHGDFHLRSTSLGVDFAPNESVDRSHPFDLDGNPRIVDLPGIPPQFGPMDLGAYETQTLTIPTCATADTVFCDGFEHR